ncbi:hypothetical protein RHGRI_012415 [Rhododendron griersonianum]|uniref:Uncharacterized protein n=1 Tax=Rhododendron griersonianum TaxID=479676 RepID=A0AAV6KQB9_9ERIC|nr:hypothetical protein RHGRI_012415 [Rhododendron griersonianum]
MFESFLTDCGLCYDSSTDEYKAVVAYEGCYDSGDGNKREAIIASLKSKRWTGYRFPYKLKSGPVVNDRLHWVVNREEDGTRFPVQQIVCFDLLVDKFVEFSTPPSYDGDRNVILGLGVLDGCLCVARYRHNKVNGNQILVYNPSEDSRKHITSAPNIFACEESFFSPDSCGATNIFACEESLVSPDSCGGGNDWRIERADLWNLVYDHSNRVRQNYDQCQFRAYDPFEWDDMYDWEEDDDYDWEEEDFLKKEKQRHRMRIRTKNL